MRAPAKNARAKDARAGFLIVLLAGVFAYGLIRTYSIRFAVGDVYPDYSSMKASPSGAKLLYDSLAGIAGLSVARNYFPLNYLEIHDAAILLLAVPPRTLAQGPLLGQVERLAGSGNRVVVTLDYHPFLDGSPVTKPDEGDVAKRWKVSYGYDAAGKSLYFGAAPDWRVLAQSGDRILAVEKDFAKGSVVFFAGSRDFRNRGVAQLGEVALISAALGGKQHVVFDEQHFGMADSGTVVGLARHFRLGGVALGLALCAALFLWKNAASFPPPVEAARRETLSGRTSLSGLHAMLRRHVQPADLAATCWNEWLAGNGREVSPERRARAEAILRERGHDPLPAVREIQSVLQAKGPL